MSDHIECVSCGGSGVVLGQTNRQVQCPNCLGVSASEREIARLTAEVERMQHDALAYRLALGYEIPGDHDGLLSDGRQPLNGPAMAAWNQYDAMRSDFFKLQAVVEAAVEWDAIAFDPDEAALCEWQLHDALVDYLSKRPPNGKPVVSRSVERRLKIQSTAVSPARVDIPCPTCGGEPSDKLDAWAHQEPGQYSMEAMVEDLSKRDANFREPCPTCNGGGLTEERARDRAVYYVCHDCGGTGRKP